ncbi:MAG: DUF4340 domain-containing protein [Gemmataceae bacterium]|nr:DUF4340 domain-containing protein [Gemmataceae bacterium]
MNFKTTYLLFGSLAALFVLLGFALFLDPGAVESSEFLFPQMRTGKNTLQVDEVERLEIERKKPDAVKLAFKLDGETKRWEMTSPHPARADKFAIQEIVRQLRDARPDSEADRPSSLSQWGLDNPAAILTLGKKDGSHTFTLKIGNTSPGETSAVVYVISSDRPNEPLAVKKSHLDALLKPTISFRDRDLLCPSVADIKSFQLEEKGKPSLALEKTGDNQWKYSQPAYGQADYEGPESADPVKQAGGVRGALMNLSNIKVDFKDEKNNDFVADAVTDLAKYKLDPAKNKVLRIAIERVEEGNKSSKAALLVSLDEKVGEGKDKYFACMDEPVKDVVRVSAATIDPLLKLLAEPESLRERILVKFPALSVPDAVVVKNSAGALEFFKPNPEAPWQYYRPGKATQEAVDGAAVANLISLFTRKEQIKSFVNSGVKEADLGLDKPVADISFYVDGIEKQEKKEEKKEEKQEEKKDKGKEGEKKGDEKTSKPEKPKLKPGDPKVRVLLGKKENGQVAFKRITPGETLYGKVPELFLDRALDGPLAYLDPSLPRFTENPDPAEEVSRIQITRAGKVTEAARAKKEDPWKMVLPTEQAGKNADPGMIRHVLTALNQVRCNKFVAEKPAPGDLTKEFALNPPAIKAVVTVGLDKDAKTFEYAFGKETPDKLGVFARQTWRDFVFLTDKTVPTALESDLHDLAIFPGMNPANIEWLKITGWQKVTGSASSLELDKKDMGWEVKAPKDFKLDAGKADLLALTLSLIKADKFITFKSGPKPEQEFDLAKGGMKIEFRLKGEKDPQSLSLGKVEGEKNTFGMSSKFPGDVFLLPKIPFETLRGKPAYFNP